MTTHSKKKQDSAAGSGPEKMDTATAQWFLSLQQTEAMDSTQQTGSLQELERWNVFTSIDDLPFSVYVDCACSGEFKALSTAKITPPPGVLSFGWQNIQQQFNEAVGGERMERATTLAREIEKLNMDIDRVQILIDSMLKYGPYEELADQLREEGFDREYSEESYIEDLRIVSIQAKRLVLQKKLKTEEADKLLPEQVEGELPTRATYAKCLINISKHVKYGVKIHDLSTREFCIYYRDFIDHVESSKAASAED